MMGEHERLEPLFQHMCIDFGCGHVRVSQKHLDGAQIGTIGQKMRGESMTQCMRRDLVWRHAGGDGQFLDQKIKPVPCQVTGFAP